ncbi:hypothetical protein JQ628_08725 [Bradyrhizobium lablabi]|uniref:hypothetical protein n=1 Tax=Bradyrhizobium lablabi TaxID=722472 RepID=UPI001BAB61D3|nr:hypothetical protein [Bradyrhizobium lablabi]MBR1121592.1 hypothetical protein [Bradyrhizobium lablabi]
MTILIEDRRVSGAVASPARYFYFNMALACAAVAFIGFAPTYFVPLASGKFSAPAIIHLHGMVFFAWSIFFVFQAWLASSGQVMRHRSVGLIGVSLATTMTIFGVLAAIASMKRAAAIGQADAGIAFSIVPLTGIAAFAVIFALGVAAVRDPEAHKRLMLLAGISVLDAAVARWFLTFLAPPGPAGPPPVVVTIPPAFVAYLLLVVAMVHDWRTRGRPHPVYVIGGIALIAVKLLNLPISETQAWHAFAGGLLAMAQ